MGFLGCLSTLSTFIGEFNAMRQSEHPWHAYAYAAATIIISFTELNVETDLPFVFTYDALHQVLIPRWFIYILAVNANLNCLKSCVISSTSFPCFIVIVTVIPHRMSRTL